MAAAMSMDEKKWQAEDDLRALRRAEEVGANRARKAAVQKLVRQEQKALAKVGVRTTNKPKGGKRRR